MKAGKITAAKDPTRGGIAMALNEMAERSQASIIIDEDKIPIREEVRGRVRNAGIGSAGADLRGQGSDWG